MGVGAGLYMYVVVVQKFTFAISSPDELLYPLPYTAQMLKAVTQICVFGILKGIRRI